MKRFFTFLMMLMLLCAGCGAQPENEYILATTKPVFDFTSALCRGTGISVRQLVTENVSCLHDYTLQVGQMRLIEGAKVIVLSGAGMEAFLHDALSGMDNTVEASRDISLICNEHHHEAEEEHSHHHEEDPHVWLNSDNAQRMAETICQDLIRFYPEHQAVLQENLQSLNEEFSQLKAYGEETLGQLSTREMITFHDGFAYFAQQWDLTILKAVEEEAGSEASAGQLKELITLVQSHQLPAVFVEESGNSSASRVIAAETGIPVFRLNMGMSEMNYFEAMYHNINTVKEAMG